MKKLYFLLFTLLISIASFGQTTVFINEIHYDNSGSDVNEGVEIAGPAGTDLTNYTITLYNGNGGASYNSVALSGLIPNEGSSGYGAVWFPISGIQNGGPDGIALDNGGALIQFLSYEGSFTGVGGVADGVLSTDIGVSEPGSPIGESLQLTGTGDTYEEFSWSAPSTASPDLINPGQTFSSTNIPTISIFDPSSGTVFNPGTTNVDVTWTTTNLTGNEFVNVIVNMGAPNSVAPTATPFSVATMDGTSYDVTVELRDAGNALLDSDTTSFSVGVLTTVADLAAVRADYNANGPGAFYSVQSTPTVTYTRTSRNQKYIQDASAAILIDDAPGIITTTFSIGSTMSGLVGQVSEFNGIMQFNPTQDAAVAGSNTITPEVVTLAQIIANQEDYESELVRINDVTFAAADGTATFAASTSYDIADPSARLLAASTFRTNFSEADYIGQVIPQGAISINTFVGEFNGTPQVTSRALSDIALSTDNFDRNEFSIFPNPTNTGEVNISSVNASPIAVAVFDVLGKQVKSETISNNRLNVSNLKSGIYLLRITQDGATSTKKLVIR
ncbi:putative secreted protein (Por secretion system target) [Winogradskyella wandonensis]|uniref:Putative secreted protein (Por secretion system target) n=1 Tax=Winogradskyella wandonensis TaxID=1442586 RepID=A0A4R1KN90_9FLAO|nr:T9SS type A sorting domain-containing protein [Winogradskyella wandonensis]TCK65139.1 putative secreted protein (Por secretion system target) [Winogradskyella wandonensis]